ncbi:MAG TPA: hypothetical protein VM759_12795 [Longimicrobium sp.]|nr:hypothetical protein [Longimicrobium sp.]
MSVGTVTRDETKGLPDPLILAQRSIHLPEVQEMLKRLSAYNLGICMPHMHDEETGAFAVLPDDVVQVEDAMEVTFRSRAAGTEEEFYLPVGWMWRESARSVDEMCAMKCVTRPPDTMHYSTRKRD